MNKKRAKFLLNLVLIVFLFGIIFLIYNRNSIKADYNPGTFKSEKDFSLVLNGRSMKFLIKSYSQNDLNKSYLFRSTVFKTKRVELLGFEDDINLCNKSTLKLREKEAICLVGDVGVHSQNIAFVDKDMLFIKNLTTDAPNYQILDYNNDGSDDLIIDNRDYDKDPLIDVIRSYYLWSGNDFTFDKSENIAVKY